MATAAHCNAMVVLPSSGVCLASGAAAYFQSLACRSCSYEALNRVQEIIKLVIQILHEFLSGFTKILPTLCDTVLKKIFTAKKGVNLRP